jgi:hypothetical protein
MYILRISCGDYTAYSPQQAKDINRNLCGEYAGYSPQWTIVLFSIVYGN